MKKEERPLKGGLGGRKTRMHERFSVETPSNDLLNKYLVFYSLKDLYLGTNVTAPTSESLFGNSHPLHFDFGCGRGEFLLHSAAQNPSENFVGVDNHKKSLFFALHHAAHLKLDNVKFLFGDLRRLMPYIPDEVSNESSLLFPAPIVDPRYLENDVMTDNFLSHVYRTLLPDGNFVFITDAVWYFQKKLELIQTMGIFNPVVIKHEIEEPLTRYQRQWQSKGIPSNRAEFEKVTFLQLDNKLNDKE